MITIISKIVLFFKNYKAVCEDELGFTSIVYVINSQRDSVPCYLQIKLRLYEN